MSLGRSLLVEAFLLGCGCLCVRLGKEVGRNEAGPRTLDHFDDMAQLVLSPAILQPRHLPGPGEVGRAAVQAALSKEALGRSALQRPAVSWAMSKHMKQFGKRKLEELNDRFCK